MPYTVEEAFQVLQRYGITDNIEVIRRWLRQGRLKGIPPKKRRDGWRIEEEDLRSFLISKAPGLIDVIHAAGNSNDLYTIKVVNEKVDEKALEEAKEEARAQLWWELVQKFIFEDYVEIGKQTVTDLLKARRYDRLYQKKILDQFFQDVEKGRKKRVYYLHGYFPYKGQRLALHEDYSLIEEKVAARMIEVIQQDLRNGMR
ncbi:helix-turn-helix domain-containing protein [Bacillus taeanensis]|uniref:Helix-turn-helix domain-containing protein n=1 Tax=Bacillus taeanensis TaxID=273032 RepID=A0A366XR63_9BACI|nr:helix-turn-helix domain-containing protein [Bacillus taeanensis]RBW68196.1 hypothetical protein DS031_17590 [Bacillus taeanensis]